MWTRNGMLTIVLTLSFMHPALSAEDEINIEVSLNCNDVNCTSAHFSAPKKAGVKLEGITCYVGHNANFFLEMDVMGYKKRKDTPVIVPERIGLPALSQYTGSTDDGGGNRFLTRFSTAQQPPIVVPAGLYYYVDIHTTGLLDPEIDSGYCYIHGQYGVKID